MSMRRTPPAELLKLAAQEQARQTETVAEFDQIESAARQPGFSGGIRRAMLKRHTSDLATQCGLDEGRLSSFRRGTGVLSSEELDRLSAALQLELTPTAIAH
jgi:hypothetical protein